MSIIPSVDLRDFLSTDKERKNSFIKKIGAAYEDIGFVALKGHFLDSELEEKLYGEIKKFFDLPLDTKNKYEIPSFQGQRGYVSFGKEKAKGRQIADLKEFWHFGQYLDQASQEKLNYLENVTVKELPEFNNVGKEVYQKLEKTAIYVLRALALHLGLDEFYFDPYAEKGNSILRPIHYPPIQKEPAEAVRAAAHGDINLITLLMGAHGKGLQVQNHKGEWVDALAQPDELMINVGDMLSRHTNNKLKSTIHRVVNPPKEMWGKSRYSIPFFMHPIGSMKLNVLPECIDKNTPKAFEDITAGEYLQERLDEIRVSKK